MAIAYGLIFVLAIPLLIFFGVLFFYHRKSKEENKAVRISLSLFIGSIAIFIWSFVDIFIRNILGGCSDWCGIEYLIIWPVFGAIGIISLIVYFIVKTFPSESNGQKIDKERNIPFKIPLFISFFLSIGLAFLPFMIPYSSFDPLGPLDPLWPLLFGFLPVLLNIISLVCIKKEFSLWSALIATILSLFWIFQIFSYRFLEILPFLIPTVFQIVFFIIVLRIRIIRKRLS